MKKLIVVPFIFILTAGLLYAGESEEYYKSIIAGAEVYIFSVKDNQLNTNIFINSSSEAASFNKHANPNGIVEVKHNVMVIKKDDANILVDTGFSDTIENLRVALSTAGLKFEDITHIIITHAHLDHIGGLTKDNKPCFPKAEVYINKKEYDYFFKTNINKVTGRAKRNIGQVRNILLNYGGKINVYNQGRIIDEVSGITAVNAFGHTPGHSLINIKDDNTNLLFLADLFHIYNVQNDYPEMAVTFDMDKDMAVKSRIEIMKKYKNSGVLITGSHTPFTIPVEW